MAEVEISSRINSVYFDPNGASLQKIRYTLKEQHLHLNAQISSLSLRLSLQQGYFHYMLCLFQKTDVQTFEVIDSIGKKTLFNSSS